MYMKKNKLLLVGVLLCGSFGFAEIFIERAPIYGVVKPAKISTVIAVNNGIASQIPYQVGDLVKVGSSLIRVLEKETNRNYRSSISGKVAKIHVSASAVVTPGMPLVTVVDPNAKKIEVTLSPKEAQNIGSGSKLFYRGQNEPFGSILKVSPIVDPDSGGVISYAMSLKKMSQLIGDVIPLDVVMREIPGCKIVKINEIDRHIASHDVMATSGQQACLKEKNEK
jgi:multidrug efflux pump subunit AcrA (membrane-fusion protein)